MASLSKFINDNTIDHIFLKIIKQISPLKDQRRQTNKKYEEFKYIREIIRFVTSGSVYWSKFKSHLDIHKKHRQYCKMNAYGYLRSYLLNKYKKLVPKKVYKTQMIDTKYIKNYLGTEYVDRNPYYKNKKGFKISEEVDGNGVWFSLTVSFSSESDGNIMSENLNNRWIHINTLDVKDNNQHKQYYLADSAYDSLKIKNKLIEKGYMPIIPQNKRNLKDETKLQHMSEKEKGTYKHRIKIENSFAWDNNYPVICGQYEKSIESYIGLYLLCSSIMLYNKISVITLDKMKTEDEIQLENESKLNKKEQAKLRREKENENQEKLKLLRKIENYNPEDLNIIKKYNTNKQGKKYVVYQIYEHYKQHRNNKNNKRSIHGKLIHECYLPIKVIRNIIEKKNTNNQIPRYYNVTVNENKTKEIYIKIYLKHQHNHCPKNTMTDTS